MSLLLLSCAPDLAGDLAPKHSLRPVDSAAQKHQKNSARDHCLEGYLEKGGKKEVCFKRAESRRRIADSACWRLLRNIERPSGQGEIPDRRYGVFRDDGRQARELRSLARGRSGVRPEPTVTVRMGEGRTASTSLSRGVCWRRLLRAPGR